MFGIGDYVVYPTQGVGTIEKIEIQDIGGVKAEFYIVRILNSNITLMVPSSNAPSARLRSICSVLEADELILYLQDKSDVSGFSGQNWNRRYREYTERLKSNSLKDVAYVLKELAAISENKELSFGERRLFEQAVDLISQELSCTLKKDVDNMRQIIVALFADVLTQGNSAQSKPAQDN